MLYPTCTWASWYGQYVQESIYASHDLLQPMHAARLFSTVKVFRQKKTAKRYNNLTERCRKYVVCPTRYRSFRRRQPKRQPYPLHDLLSDLELNRLLLSGTFHWKFMMYRWYRPTVDSSYYSKLCQQCYTAKGRVVVGVLRSAQQPFELAFGIPDLVLPKNNEFPRIWTLWPFITLGWTRLGLAIVQRMTGLLNYPVHVSWAKAHALWLRYLLSSHHNTSCTSCAFKNQSVPYFDNDETILEGMSSLLGRWGYSKLLNLNRL